MDGPRLRRDLGVVTLTLYGLGVIVGAGIYVLVGDVAGLLGNATWMAFVGAALAALPTGLSYAELASRYPRSAGEAVFADRAFGRAGLSFLVGYLVLASGMVSSATLSHGFADYFSNLTALPATLHTLIAVAFLAGLSLVNHWGIRESAWLNGLCTVVSVSALLVIVVVAAGSGYWGTVDILEMTSPVDPIRSRPEALLAGVALAFYAFIGFEDICNVAEEVDEPHRTIPKAILLSVGIGAFLYATVGITVVSVVPAGELAASSVPLVEVSRRLFPDGSGAWLGVVALFAVTNSTLFNLIMCSRVLYGMAEHGWMPAPFATVHSRRHTPTWGVIAAFVLATLFAVTGVLRVLAEATNTIILTVFFSVNLSLLVVKVRKVPPDDSTHAHFRISPLVPLLGIGSTLWLIGQFSAGAYTRGGLVVAVGIVLFLIRASAARRRR